MSSDQKRLLVTGMGLATPLRWVFDLGEEQSEGRVGVGSHRGTVRCQHLRNAQSPPS